MVDGVSGDRRVWIDIHHQDRLAWIARLLENRTAKSDWSAGHYGTLAAKAGFAAADTVRSRNIVRLALPIEQTPQLLYLDRVLNREQALDRRQLSAATPVNQN